ncbi:carbohydrate ABC transporter permease [uncultured Sphaerochaeta sp.]|uniref:carbohydrate ABC transporter permease n=1 Tax=uncultured Sphaerochaeta sp. TaxID=886478 RepID=UPI002A0A8E7C|nr:carbohydrate ABC transporter permease [uncultured Sphaerochaeta sp.]
MKKYNMITTYILAILVALFFLAPVSWLVSSSFQQEKELLSVPSVFLTKKPTVENYKKLLFPQSFATSSAEGVNKVRTYSIPHEARLFAGSLGNSFIVSVSTTLVCLFFGTLAAYSVTRLRYRGRKIFMFGIMGSRMVPGLVLVVPFFIIANKIGGIDKKSWLILVYCSFSLPYIFWILKGFFETIPVELEDAARIDGCTRLQTIWKIIFPVILPGMVASGIFAFMQTWNEFFYALILTNSSRAFTVPVITGMFATEVDIDYSLLITSGVLSMLPPILFTFIFQKYIIAGLTSGGVKG